MPFTTRKETIKVAGGDDRDDHRPRDQQRPAALRPRRRAGKVGKNGHRRQRGPRPRRRLRGRAALDRAGPRHDHGRGLRAQQGDGLRRLPQGGRATSTVPSQNLIYADTKGNIGYQAPGQDPDPRARATTARYPAPGWDPRYRWTRLHPAGRAALRVQPRARLHRHRQPGRRRRGQVPVHCSPRTGATAPAASGSTT